MENLVITTFQDEQNATEALQKLKELDQLDDIAIYNVALLRKTGEDTFEFLHHEGPDFGDRPMIGALAGTAIGAIAGPIGMAIGMLTGTMAGAVYEGDAEDFSDDFLEKVNTKIDAGTFAIILDVEEDTELMIDSYMEPYHGTIIRSNFVDEYEQFDRRQWNELNKEIDAEERALKAALDEDRASVQARIDKLKAERKKIIANVRTKAANKKKHIEEKIAALDKKIKASGDKVKEKLKSQRAILDDNLKKFNEDVEWAFSVEY